MRKLFILFGVISIILVGCASEDETKENNDNITKTTDSAEAENDNNEEEVEGEVNETSENTAGTVDEDEFDTMYNDPEAYENYDVEFTGVVFIEPEKDEDGVYLQVYSKPENYEQNIIVGYEDPEFEVEEEDYVQIEGIIQGEMEGENLMGGDLSVPIVYATDLEVVDYATAVAPAIDEVEIDETIEQHGIEVYVEKMEIAEKETRVYLTVNNDTDDAFTYYDFNSKLITGNEQLDAEDNYESDLPEIQSEILPGIETEGVFTYPAIDEDEEKVTFHSEGSSDNYELDFEPFTLEIEL